jgi:ketosteroid isomerase-like protein
MPAHDEVREASRRFYAALNRMLHGDPASLTEIWSHDAEVTTMHPIGGREVGWDGVRRSFEQVSTIASNGHVDLKDQRIEVVGDLAYEIGTEQGAADFAGESVSIGQRVTNVYRREAGAWKIVHHHTDLSPAMLDVLKRLKAGSAAR